MNYLNINGTDEKYEFKVGNTLLNILHENNIGIEIPCGGKGTCGKCKIKIVTGEINDKTDEEVNHLTKCELEEGIRLACLVIPKGDLTVELLQKKDLKHSILTEGYMPDIKINPLISKKVYNITKPTLENNISYEDILKDISNNSLHINNPILLRKLPKAFEQDQITAVYSDEELIGIEYKDTSKSIFGLSIDIGTTTVVGSLVDLSTGKEIDVESEINPQKEYGLDVLSRIHFIKNNSDGLEILHNLIIKCINKLILKLCNKNDVCSENIHEVAVAANATMMHILLKVNPVSIGKSPYSPIFSSSKTISASSLGINISSFGVIYCLPGVSSYIGSDIVAGAVVSELSKTDKNILFIDIGTNGEIVLSKKGKLSSCSCAAGPALEGMNISCGMRAQDGAIEGVNIDESGIELKVIGNTDPIGICGSGIIEVISEIVRLNLMGKTGRLKKKDDLKKDEKLKEIAKFVVEENKKRKFLINSKPKEIYITQSDIRQVQLAKGAILSGFYALLELMEIDMNDLDEIIIAGQFGKHLSIDSLVGVGIVPEKLREKIRYIGNSSKTGALMCLISKEAREDMEKTSREINYFELSTKEGYERLFTSCLNFY
ncbi:ASKHA domain-containing protein [Tepidibacter hydrothermalis]|uniref:ASKHA domain-containing protein n=1 Tax=Tepidibacter hydrothermalis TaxID=3036126 RepID=A0ABY8EDT8_9FIRM|nr:ASKHA domain-containing protein [Tepidibacter hydrothermalis]WFD11109.1 ASKHA domain-containing protein [Tepidibacter hydrothermalis]